RGLEMLMRGRLRDAELSSNLAIRYAAGNQRQAFDLAPRQSERGNCKPMYWRKVAQPFVNTERQHRQQRLLGGTEGMARAGEADEAEPEISPRDRHRKPLGPSVIVEDLQRLG